MTGTSAAIIFEHGILSGGYAWQWIVSRLPDEVLPVVHDRRGKSTFDIAFRRIDYRAVGERMTQSATIDLESCERIIVVGHSIGALHARAHANAYGSRVQGIVYVDPSPPDQFEPAADTDYQFLRLQQLLWTRALKSLTPTKPQTADVEVIQLLPPAVRADAIAQLTDHRFWLNAYREARAAGSRWLDASLFPCTEERRVVVVSSSVSALPDSIQNRFEERLLTSATPSNRVVVREASHETILYDEKHSIAVNQAINWVLDAETM